LPRDPRSLISRVRRPPPRLSFLRHCRGELFAPLAWSASSYPRPRTGIFSSMLVPVCWVFGTPRRCRLSGRPLGMSIATSRNFFSLGCFAGFPPYRSSHPGARRFRFCFFDGPWPVYRFRQHWVLAPCSPASVSLPVFQGTISRSRCMPRQGFQLSSGCRAPPSLPLTAGWPECTYARAPDLMNCCRLIGRSRPFR